MDFVGLQALCRRWKGGEISSSFSNVSLDFPCQEYLDSWSLLAISDNFLGLTLASFLFNFASPAHLHLHLHLSPRLAWARSHRRAFQARRSLLNCFH